MFKLSYIIGGKTIESFIFPAVGLARWKKRQLQQQASHKTGKLIITKI